MTESNNLGVTKMENFLEAALEGYSNFWFKSPSKDKGMYNVESLPLSCKQTPIMSPLPSKYSITQSGVCDKILVKKIKRELKFTPLKDIVEKSKLLVNSADKARGISERLHKKPADNSQNNNTVALKPQIDYNLAKVSRSDEKLRKFEPKTATEEKKVKVVERSPLIPNKNIDGSLLSPDSSRYQPDLIQDSEHLKGSSGESNRRFSPRKALDFADKHDDYQGRNLFDDNYQ